MRGVNIPTQEWETRLQEDLEASLATLSAEGVRVPQPFLSFVLPEGWVLESDPTEPLLVLATAPEQAAQVQFRLDLAERLYQGFFNVADANTPFEVLNAFAEDAAGQITFEGEPTEVNLLGFPGARVSLVDFQQPGDRLTLWVLTPAEDRALLVVVAFQSSEAA
ncbi:MAG: hypothetical protein HC915_21720 [Anaerolineae bacterium]|nr:hypothetical protein [Anaerolineae bacterium]